MISSLLFLLASTTTGSVDVAVVCPVEFRTELAPWVRHRVAQGHKLAWVDATGTAQDIHRRLKSLADLDSLRSVVLVGDVPQHAVGPGVPTFLVPAKINIRWGSEPEIASDHSYSDFDGDQLPDVAIGRISVRSAAELRVVVQKILAYENSTNFGQWRRRVSFVAGLGGFGAIADAAIEAAAKKLITDGVPAGFCTSMTYGSWRSPYCPDPRVFRHATLNTLNEGCLFWVYIGHGHRRSLDQVRVPGGQFPILADGDISRLQCHGGSPIACFLACSTGEYDHAEDCLAEQMLRAPGGPVAVLAGSRVTMPYAMSVLGLGMIEACFGQTPVATLGEAALRSKRSLMQTDNLDINRQSLDSLAALVSPPPADLVGERTEHLYLFNLLGDPLLRLPQPQRVEVAAPHSIKPGETIAISGISKIHGPTTVELIVRRDRLTFKTPARPQFEPTNEFLALLQESYQKANDPTLVATQVMPDENGEFHCSLNVPDDATGDCHVRVFVEGENSCGVGFSDLEIAP